MTKNNSKDLTVGSPTGLILGFSLPLLLGMLFQQVYSLMDTIIVGRFLSVSALAAVGSTGSICFLIIGFCQGVCAGFSLPIAQRFGAKDEKGLKKYVGNAGIVSVIIAIIMTALTVLLCAKRRNLNNSRTVNFNKIASVYNIIRHNKIYKDG